MKSAGRSTKPTPGRPQKAVRYASRMLSGSCSKLGGLTASFVCGASSDTASSCWKAPFVGPAVVSELPASSRSGNVALTVEFPTYFHQTNHSKP